MKKIIFIVFVVIVFLTLIALVFDWGRGDDKDDILYNQESFIKLDHPKENQELKSPIKVSGQARGSWFFEGSFPVKLIDTDGATLAVAIATSTEDWMTEDFIPFYAMLVFVKPTSTKHAILVLKKDNPSGLSELDDSIFIPVLLK